MSRNSGIAWCVAGVLGLGWVMAVAARPAPETAPVELTVHSFRKLIVVPVEIGGHDDLNFVLDSGSVATTVNDLEIAELLGLHTRPLGMAVGFNGARLPVFSAPDVEVSSAGVGLMRTDLVVHHVVELQEHRAGWALHGLLGADLFLRYAVEIDPDGDRVVLHPPGSSVPFEPLTVVPVEVRRRRPIVSVRLTMEGRWSTSARLLLDTGAEAEVLIVDGAKRRLRAPQDGARVQVTGIGGVVEGVVAPVESLELGQLALGDLRAAFVDRGALPSAGEFRKIDGILGNGLLGRYRCWIDLRAGRMALGPLAEPAETTDA